MPDALPESLSLAGKVAFLSALPGVEHVIETHMSVVFLTRGSALKLKKPLKIGLSDCRTLERRERAVAKEILLNRPLAPGVYLGRLPLRHTAQGFSLQGDAPVVDWLIQMKRLPQEVMLDEMIRRNRPPGADRVAALASCLIAFYRRQGARRPPRHLYALHLERESAINARHLRALATRLPRPETLCVLDDVAHGLRRLHPEILARERNGMIVEGHGDLRPEHVCLTDPPVIFDRAEAALELRAVDIWDECMFLAAECAMLGYAGIAGGLADALIAASLDPPSPRLLRVLMQFRMAKRARLALDHLRDSPSSGTCDWGAKAQSYLDAAVALGHGRDDPPMGATPAPPRPGAGHKGFGTGASEG